MFYNAYVNVFVGILHIKSFLDAVIRKSHKLIDNETNNRAELFMAILARFNLGKRHTWQALGNLPWKKYMQKSPGSHFKKYMAKEKRNLEIRKHSQPRHLFKVSIYSKKKHHNYEHKAPICNLSLEEMLSDRTRILNNLQVTKKNIKEKSKGQFNNFIYREQRKDRLTVSKFGVAAKQRTTACHCLVKNILYDSMFSTAAINYGKDNESLVLLKLENIYNGVIQESDICIDKEHGFLSAFPDGLINDDTLVEVKCVYKVNQKGIDLKEAPGTDSSICLKFENQQLQL